jgi:hypothetical protein
MSNSLPNIRSPREREQPAGSVHRLLARLPDYRTLFFTRIEVKLAQTKRKSLLDQKQITSSPNATIFAYLIFVVVLVLRQGI